MSNMSYCRFQNTLADLQDCYEHWDEEVSSKEEERAREIMLSLCKCILDDYGYALTDED
jgi:hypothetical protein